MLVASLLFVCLLRAASGADTGCTLRGGTCVDWRYYKCSAGVETGLCDGDSNRKCCLDCDNSCQADESNWASCCDSACTSAGGVCQHNTNYCDGYYSSGKCGGDSDRQCCSKSGGGGGSCTLITYSSTYIKGYNGLSVEIEPGFKNHMDDLNTYARQCNLNMVWVTHAYRDEGANLGGTVVPPSSTSNHLVGHAIDFNVDTPNGWCNGDCLLAGRDSYAECFIQKVLNDSKFRWGGIWGSPDPVHIDDGMNVYDYSQWQSLYYDLQGAC